MKTVTMIGCFFCLLSLTMNAQIMHSTNSSAVVNLQNVEKQDRPSASVQESNSKNISTNKPVIFKKQIIQSQKPKTSAEKIINLQPTATDPDGSISERNAILAASKTVSSEGELIKASRGIESICTEINLEVNVEEGINCMSNFSQGGLAQSYIPLSPSAAGAGLKFRNPPSSGLNLELSLWDGLPNAGGTMLTSGSTVTTGTIWEDVFWDPVVNVTVGSTYYIVIDGDYNLPCISGSLSNPYPGGMTYANNYSEFPLYDYTFRTYSCGDIESVCGEENPNDFTFSNGYNCSSNAIFKTANDLTVVADEDFILEKITTSLFSSNEIVNVDVNYYADNMGLPGDLIGSETSVDIDSQTIIGYSMGYDVRELKLTVSPFIFSGQVGIPTTYWIELSVTDDENNGDIFWVITSSSMIGNPVALYTTLWGYPDDTVDGVYIWEGSCMPLGNAVCLDPSNISIDAVTETTVDISWTAENSENNWIVQYGAPGFDPNAEGTEIAVNGAPNTILINLDSDTGYEVYVKANCGTVQSEFVGPINFTTTSSSPGNEFITTWATTVDNEMITIPTTGGGYNYMVDWGDGDTDSGQTGNVSHSYGSPGLYTVKISGDFPRIFFNNSGDKDKIMSIEQWGNNVWASMNSAFMGASNLVSNATDMPNLSMVTDMYGMFAYATSYTGDSNMGDWDVSNVNSMYGMFGGAFLFNADIGNWDVSNVTNMKLMFSYAHTFNQDIGGWDVGNVINMDSMFRNTTMFDQNLGSWNVSNVVNMSNMFKGITLSTTNYDALLNGWNSLPLKHNVKFSGGKSRYCNGEIARQNMIVSFNWIITDGGMDCGGAPGKQILDNTSLAQIVLYPNPMRNKLNIGNPNSLALESASIYDLTGRLVLSLNLIGVASDTDFDVSVLSKATYVIVIKSENADQITRLMVKD